MIKDCIQNTTRYLRRFHPTFIQSSFSMYHGQSPTAVPPPQWQTIILPHNITKLTTVNCVHSSHETAGKKRSLPFVFTSQAILESLLFGEPLLKTENILDHVFPFGQFVSDATSTPHTGQTWAPTARTHVILKFQQ